MMTSFLYLLACITLSALAVLELKTRNRRERVKLHLTLLGALVFCGTFTLLVTLAQLNGGQYQPLAAAGVLLLTAGSVLVVTRTSGRFAAMQSGPRNQL